MLTGNGAWMAMEIVTIPAIVASARALTPITELPHASQFVLGLFLLHYVHRALIQPLRNPPRSPLHASVVLSAIAFNCINGYLHGTWIARGVEAQSFGAVTLAAFVLGLSLFVIGAAGNIWHDEVLRRLRLDAPPRTYGIPHGGLYRWISYPNYLCECASALTRVRMDRMGNCSARSCAP